MRRTNLCCQARLVATGTDSFRLLEQRQTTAAAGSFFHLPTLEYPHGDGIAPVISRKQLSFTRDVFHSSAVSDLNALTIGSPEEGHTLDAVIQGTAFDAKRSMVHSAASEHFNHSFAMRSLRPFGVPVPPQLRNLLHNQFVGAGGNGSLDKNLNDLFVFEALSNEHKSGWLYLVWKGTEMEIRHFAHGTCPLTGPQIPLLCVNIHEHAYCLDYPATEDGLERYVRNCIKAFNWNVAARYYDLAVGVKNLDLLGN